MASPWAEGTWPTAEQFVDWFVEQDAIKQVDVAKRMLDDAQTAIHCFTAAHDQFPDTLRHATEAIVREIRRGDRYRSAWRSARRRAKEPA